MIYFFCLKPRGFSRRVDQFNVFNVSLLHLLIYLPRHNLMLLLEGLNVGWDNPTEIMKACMVRFSCIGYIEIRVVMLIMERHCPSEVHGRIEFHS